MGFGAMLVGHLNPVVIEEVQKALTDVGTLFVTPSPTATEVAERPAPLWAGHAALSPTPAPSPLMYAVRAARAFTGRKAIIKIEGGPRRV